MQTDVINRISESDMILIGIGEELVGTDSNKEELISFYNSLADIISDKNYFVININPDSIIYESNLDLGRVTSPFSDKEEIGENGEDKQWDLYMKWLTGTLNKKLTVLELGVLLNRPNVIRWPFERIVMINDKSRLIRINNTLPQLPSELSERGISIEYNPLYFFNSIC